MKINEITSHKYIGQILQLNWHPINRATWTTIRDEGLDEEQDAPNPSQWVMSRLVISPEDSELLKTFDADTVDDFNRFDIDLKEKFPGYVDLIDYENGTVTIVKTI